VDLPLLAVFIIIIMMFQHQAPGSMIMILWAQQVAVMGHHCHCGPVTNFDRPPANWQRLDSPIIILMIMIGFAFKCNIVCY
jgi:hypothetical protein